jgi:hypothetical protein
MNLIDPSGSVLDSPWSTDRIISDVTAIADKPLADIAHRIDHEGFYPWTGGRFRRSPEAWWFTRWTRHRRHARN